MTDYKLNNTAEADDNLIISDATGGAYANLEVKGFAGTHATADESKSIVVGDPKKYTVDGESFEPAAYLRLGAASSDVITEHQKRQDWLSKTEAATKTTWKTSNPTYGPDYATEPTKPYGEDGSKDPVFFTNPKFLPLGEDLASMALDFIDDERHRGHSGPFRLELSEGGIAGDVRGPDGAVRYRRDETKLLHTRGGWRDHSDGNRISTTRGDKVEVIRGNYKLMILGREQWNDDAGEGASWEASGGMIQDGDDAPGEGRVAFGLMGRKERHFWELGTAHPAVV